MHLLRLQYSSTMVATDADAARKTLEDILAKSVHNNAELRIGGLLCFNPGDLGVVQMLEGPAFAVQSTYKKIVADPRHEHIVCTCEELLTSKADCHFDASWGMLQSETWESKGGLLDLSARLSRAAVAHTAHASASAIQATITQIREMHSDGAERQQLIDKATARLNDAAGKAAATEAEAPADDPPTRGLFGLSRFLDA